MISKELQYALTKCRSIPYEKGKARVFATIRDKKGRLVVESQNLYTKSHPLQSKYSVKAGYDELRCNLHAELRAIIFAAKKNPKDCSMQVARISGKGEALPAFPCPSCSLAIKDCGFITSIECTV